MLRVVLLSDWILTDREEADVVLFYKNSYFWLNIAWIAFICNTKPQFHLDGSCKPYIWDLLKSNGVPQNTLHWFLLKHHPKMDRDGLLLRFLRPGLIGPRFEEGQLFLIPHPLAWGILPQITFKAPMDQVTDHSSPLWNNLVSCKLVAPRMPCPNPLWAAGWVFTALLERIHLSWPWTKPWGFANLIWSCDQTLPFPPGSSSFPFWPWNKGPLGRGKYHSFFPDRRRERHREMDIEKYLSRFSFCSKFSISHHATYVKYLSLLK